MSYFACENLKAFIYTKQDKHVPQHTSNNQNMSLQTVQEKAMHTTSSSQTELKQTSFRDYGLEMRKGLNQ